MKKHEIKIEDLQQGDKINWHYDGDEEIIEMEFICIFKDHLLWQDVENESDFAYVPIDDDLTGWLKNITKWTRYGVSILEPAEAEETVKYCKIYKDENDDLCIEDSPLGYEGLSSHDIGEDCNGWTFVGFVKHGSKVQYPKSHFAHATMMCSTGKVYEWAKFVRSSSLEVES
jgi:hypothetical protein